MAIFAALTIGKIAVFLVLLAVGKAKPFVGDNSRDLYVPLGHRLLTEHRFNGPDTRPDSKVPIGYPAVLAILEGITPKHYLALTVCVQMAFGWASAAMLYGLAVSIGASPKVGILAGIAWLFFPPEVLISTWITAESLYTCVLLASICLLVHALRKGAAGGALIAGVVLGLATLMRGTCLFLPMAFLPLWLSRRSPRSWIVGMAYTLGLAVVIGPWALRNQRVLQDPILVSVGFGSAFRQGAETRYMTIGGKEKYYPQQIADAEKAGVARPTSGKESDMDHWLFQLGLYSYKLRARERPLSFIPFAVYKFARLWYGTESGGFFGEAFLGICVIPVLVLALWQMYAWRRVLPQFDLLLLLLLAYFITLHWISLPQYRYLHPEMPLLLLAASYRVFSYQTRLKRRRAPSGDGVEFRPGAS